ncbi:MAG: hypothetical protein ACLP9L_39440 [Thermoguttaceae bacterium]
MLIWKGVTRPPNITHVCGPQINRPHFHGLHLEAMTIWAAWCLSGCDTWVIDGHHDQPIKWMQRRDFGPWRPKSR